MSVASSSSSSRERGARRRPSCARTCAAARRISSLENSASRSIVGQRLAPGGPATPGTAPGTLRSARPAASSAGCGSAGRRCGAPLPPVAPEPAPRASGALRQPRGDERGRELGAVGDERRSAPRASRSAGASAKTGRSASIDRVLALGARRGRPSASSRSTRKRTNGTDASTRVGHRPRALARDEVGGVAARRQRHDAQLELAPRRDARAAQHRLLARRCRRRAPAAPSAPGARARRPARSVSAVPMSPTVLRSPAWCMRDDVGVALGDDRPRPPWPPAPARCRRRRGGGPCGRRRRRTS